MKGLDSHLAHILYGIAFYRNDTGDMAREVVSLANCCGNRLYLQIAPYPVGVNDEIPRNAL